MTLDKEIFRDDLKKLNEQLNQYIDEIHAWL